ncbi:NF-kappa-B inhibitor cactus-like [Mercenaria mercenaria]|uniref:NF-kappa-B inhibitor cactus-like n=1 Tax=Mercenaria mercenaria TaxID=6596 RepID=UPI00234EB2A3|nr:NF-kappa-B inhibitor cactus-like [Mercenaria mercenaria]
MQLAFSQNNACSKDVDMDLSSDHDLEEDCERVDLSGKDLQRRLHAHKFNSHKGDVSKEDRFDSTYSSGYGSGNLPSELNEGRFTSDEDRLIPVAGLESLTLDNDDVKTTLVSVDEGFESSEIIISGASEKCEKSSQSQDSESENSEKQLQLQQYQQVLLETYQQDDDGDTRLHTAIIQLLTDLALYFISLCPTHTLLNLKNNYLQTPLHLAVVTKQDVLTRKLMTSGAQVDCRDHRGNTPLHIASKEGYDFFVKILLEPVHYEETKNNNYELPYQQIPQNLEARNYDGQVCVHLAAEGCHIQTLNILLSKGADVNARDGKSGRTALHYAAESGCMPLLQFLVEQAHCKLDINCITYGGLTPIMLAKGRGHEQAVRLLRESGAWSDTDESSSEEEMNEEPYEDIKINGVIVNRV